jgi:hypothetical protein
VQDFGLSPARGASTAACKESKLAWNAISSMTLMIDATFIGVANFLHVQSHFFDCLCASE